MCLSPAEWVSLAKDVLVGSAALTGAIVAVTGLKSWSRELRGRAEFDVARNFVRATYKLRDEIRYCRSPLIMAHEFPDSYSAIATHTDREEAEAWNHVFRARFKPVIDAVQEFDASMLEAESLWGGKVREPAEKLRRCAREVQVAMDTIVQDHLHGGNDFKVNPQFGEKMRAVVSEFGEENELSQKLKGVIGELEAQLLPHLRRS